MRYSHLATASAVLVLAAYPALAGPPLAETVQAADAPTATATLVTRTDLSLVARGEISEAALDADGERAVERSVRDIATPARTLPKPQPEDDSVRDRKKGLAGIAAAIIYSGAEFNCEEAVDANLTDRNACYPDREYLGR